MPCTLINMRLGCSRWFRPGAVHIPQPRFIELDGADHWAFAGDQQAVLDGIRQFIADLAG
jgi:hypothetical protein